jgi:hypothetical protein
MMTCVCRPYWTVQAVEGVARVANMGDMAAQSLVDVILTRGVDLPSLTLPGLRSAAGFRFEPSRPEMDLLRGLFRLAIAYRNRHLPR